MISRAGCVVRREPVDGACSQLILNSRVHPIVNALFRSEAEAGAGAKAARAEAWAVSTELGRKKKTVNPLQRIFKTREGGKDGYANILPEPHWHRLAALRVHTVPDMA